MVATPAAPAQTSAPVGTSVVGTQLPLDAAYIQNLLLTGAINAGQFQALQAQALRAYYIDAGRLGIDAANSNFQQRLGQITTQLQAAQQGYDQRAGLADKKMQVAGMLADRSGPQNLIAYNALKTGLGGLNGKTTEVDPYSWLDGMVSSQFAAPGSNGNFDWQGMLQPVTGTLGTPPDLLKPIDYKANLQPPLTGTGATPGGAPAGGTAQAGAWSGIRNEDVAHVPSGGYFDYTTGSAGPSMASDYEQNGWDIFDPAGKKLTGAQQIGANAAVRLYRRPQANAGGAGAAPAYPGAAGSFGSPAGRFAEGGVTTAPLIMAGDAPMSQAPDAGGAKPELIANPTGAPLGIANADQTEQVMGGDATLAMPQMPAGKGGAADAGLLGKIIALGIKALAEQGQKPGAKRAAKGTGMKAKRYASGSGMYTMPDNLQYTDYGAADWGKTFGSLTSKQPGFQGFGAKIGNAKYGVSDAPWLQNMQQYLQMDDTQRQMLGSYYNQAFGTNFNDQIQQSVKASPFGADFGPTAYAA